MIYTYHNGAFSWVTDVAAVLLIICLKLTVACVDHDCGRALRHMSLNGFVRGVRLAKMSSDWFCQKNCSFGSVLQN